MNYTSHLLTSIFGQESFLKHITDTHLLDDIALEAVQADGVIEVSGKLPLNRKDVGSVPTYLGYLRDNSTGRKYSGNV